MVTAALNGALLSVPDWNYSTKECLISHSRPDCSSLTVTLFLPAVFDDGDEKTLRRSSLCLKGARHFAESEVSHGPPCSPAAESPTLLLKYPL